MHGSIVEMMNVVRQRKTPAEDYKMLRKRLRQLAREKGPEGKLPTVRELCATFMTNSAVMDRALGELEDQRLIYRRQGSGIYVSAKIRERSICLIFGSSRLSQPGHSPFWDLLWSLFINHAQVRARETGESFAAHVATSSASSEDVLQDSLVDAIEAGELDGVIAISLGNHICDWLCHRTPISTFASAFPGNIGSNKELHTGLAVDELTRLGCRKIGAWCPWSMPPSSVSEMQRATFVAEMSRHGGYEPKYSRFYGTGHDAAGRDRGQDLCSYQQQGYQLAEEIFGAPDGEKPDGLYICDDMMASGAITALMQMGVRPGAGVKIVSHANAGSPILFGYDRMIARVEIDPDEIVRKVLQALDYRMDCKEPPPEVQQVTPRLRRAGE